MIVSWISVEYMCRELCNFYFRWSSQHYLQRGFRFFGRRVDCLSHGAAREEEQACENKEWVERHSSARWCVSKLSVFSCKLTADRPHLLRVGVLWFLSFFVTIFLSLFSVTFLPAFVDVILDVVRSIAFFSLSYLFLILTKSRSSWRQIALSYVHSSVRIHNAKIIIVFLANLCLCRLRQRLQCVRYFQR